MRRPGLILIPLATLLLPGCVARTVAGVVTAPVRVVSQGADWATTSQDEADRARGREIRRREERLGELQEDYERLERRCLDGNDRACREAVALRAEMDELRQGIPLEPED
ncbi:MAG: hypothetical protein KDE15_10225 [Erythrobacter sp.]|nr:hypothetical protein [Erythrobacter sp.]